MTNFNSDQYWIERGQVYQEQFKAKRPHRKIPYWIQERYIDNAFNMVAERDYPRRIFEAGCGFGRITRMLCRRFPFAKINALDISEDQLRYAKATLPRVRFRQTSITAPVGGIPINDLAVAVELLMHLPPENIEAAIEGLTRGAQGFIITVDWHTSDAVDLSVGPDVFCWVHSYEELFEAQGFELFQAQKIPFVAQKIRIWRLNK